MRGEAGQIFAPEHSSLSDDWQSAVTPEKWVDNVQSLLILSTTFVLSISWSPLLSQQACAIIPAGFVDASSFGFSATDATAALQAAINTGQNVYVPNMGTDWNVTPITLTRDNQEIFFEPGTVVAAKRGAFMGDEFLFSASNRQNVTLNGYGATFKMRKADYTQPPYPQSEYRHAIALGGVENFEIRGLTIKDSGGDGIYVGSGIELYSENVTIRDVVLQNNYRQGISVIGVKGLLIENVAILDTRGTNPQAGIDFEPNYPQQPLENIVVRNSIIGSNGTHGILFATNVMNDPANDVSAEIDNVTFFDNTGSGIMFNQPVPNVKVTDSIFYQNHDHGVTGTASTLDLLVNGPPRNSIEYSGFWENDEGARGGWTSLGTGSFSNESPLFYSMDPASPYFMYLSSDAGQRYVTGASDGGYIGGRPVFVPEPAYMVGAVVSITGLIACRRRDSFRSMHVV